jgi:hypothetical protein
MRNCSIGATILFLVTVLTTGSFLFAQSGEHPEPANAKSKSPAFDPHDFNGVWDTAPFMQPRNEVHPFGGPPGTPPPPFTPEGEAKYEANVKFIESGAVLDCDPLGASRALFSPRPFEIFVSRDRLLQHFEYYDNWREIWTNGRKFDSDVMDPSYMGFSTGRWEGDAFVVDVVGYNGKTFLSSSGLPLSDAMHQTERWQRVDYDTLRIIVTLDDPKMYSKPWTVTYFYKLKDWSLNAIPCTMTGNREWDQKMGHVDRLPGLDYKSPKR